MCSGGKHRPQTGTAWVLVTGPSGPLRGPAHRLPLPPSFHIFLQSPSRAPGAKITRAPFPSPLSLGLEHGGCPGQGCPREPAGASRKECLDLFCKREKEEGEEEGARGRGDGSVCLCCSLLPLNTDE